MDDERIGIKIRLYFCIRISLCLHFFFFFEYCETDYGVDYYSFILHEPLCLPGDGSFLFLADFTWTEHTPTSFYLCLPFESAIIYPSN